MPDSEKDPAVELPPLVGRKLRAEEVYEAFGLKKSGYYEQLARGTLASPDRLLSVARYFGLNYVNLLILFDHITMKDVAAVAAEAVQSAQEVEELGKSLAERGRGRILDRLLELELARQPGVNPL
jgi:hypothetical protein